MKRSMVIGFTGHIMGLFHNSPQNIDEWFDMRKAVMPVSQINVPEQPAQVPGAVDYQPYADRTGVSEVHVHFQDGSLLRIDIRDVAEGAQYATTSDLVNDIITANSA